MVWLVKTFCLVFFGSVYVLVFMAKTLKCTFCMDTLNAVEKRVNRNIHQVFSTFFLSPNLDLEIFCCNFFPHFFFFSSVVYLDIIYSLEVNYRHVFYSFSLRMCCEHCGKCEQPFFFKVCGTVPRSHPALSWMYKQHWVPRADRDKRQAYGRGREESGGSRSHVGKGGVSRRSSWDHHQEEEMSDLQDSAFSWETRRLWRTHTQFTHIYWEHGITYS